MKFLPIFFCLLSIAFAVRDKQLNLEDIEKDNLASERRVQHVPRTAQEQVQVPHQFVSPPQPITPPKFQYGFKPMKNPQQYTTKTQYTPTQQHLNFASQQQLNLASPQQLNLASQQQLNLQLASQQHLNLGSQQHLNLASQQQYVLPQYYATYQPIQQHQQQQQQQQQQHGHQPQQTFLPPSKAQQYIQANSQYQHLQIPYVTDNHIPQDTNALQQYYTPQYVLYQQVPDASNNVQTVVDPKAGVQYVMYIPSNYLQGAKAEQTQNVEALLQPQSELFATPGYTVAQALQQGEQQYQYVLQQPQASVPAQPQHLQVQAQIPKFQDIQYVQPLPVQQKSPKFEFVSQKYEPKSLLDSYVPSILQVQYYKQQQQQAQANAIRHSLKAATQPITGKGDFVKNYVPPASASNGQSYNIQYTYNTQNVKQH